MLTEKCKIDFDEYFLDRHETIYLISEWFESLDFSMQWGVYINFFDGAGINIGVQKNHLDTFNNWVGHPVEGGMPSKETRQEAQISVIERANEIYNSTDNEVNVVCDVCGNDSVIEAPSMGINCTWCNPI